MVAEKVGVAVPLLIGVPVPLLMLAEKEGNEENREFFDLTNGITYTMNFPELAGKQCLGVGIPGWLFTADGEGNMNLFHLNSRALIKLPHMNTLQGFNYDDERGYCEHYVQKAVLSSDPHNNNDDEDYILMISQGVPHTLAYWKPGKNAFITVETRRATYSDVTWHDGQFYGVDVRGRVVILDFRGGLEPTIGRMIQGVPSEFICGMHLYIVHSQGELFVITRDGIFPHPETKTYGVKEFIVFKVDVDNESHDEVNDLGNTSLFLGFSASVAVDDVQQYGCRANHIYFTDDCSCAYYAIEKGGGKDMGIYNLLDDTIEPHYTGESYHRFTPPIWIFNTPFVA
ncbi:putative F-box protein At1g65770 [Solanum pennellii]|uniref:F-box protein At1g65770 n=1 Tax=Solanum pennellii TaxID=28526 RepID=A0ABM1VB66_SOLPN|nr:putative F-box protein At1g65770 [Solanum pennellii]